ncbi:hypothetical protein BJX76DRAFT_335869 [Aspergillus varians]
MGVIMALRRLRRWLMCSRVGVLKAPGCGALGVVLGCAMLKRSVEVGGLCEKCDIEVDRWRIDGGTTQQAT